MQDLLVATGNQGKFREICEALEGVSVNLLSLKDFCLGSDGLVEDGGTFEENAKKKAGWFYHQLKIKNEESRIFDNLPFVLGEDSGVLVDALPGELGVRTRRWGAGEEANDEEWVEYFLERMGGVPDDERGAKFVCCACLYGNGVVEFFKGETRGVVTRELMAPVIPGIPLSSCFVADGCDKVYAALSVDEKNRLSHRGKAMRELKSFLYATA